jgi:hypothetical protein
MDYPYPVHIDEWVHLAYSKAMAQQNSVTIVEPFFGRSMIGIGSNLEAGFHLLWATFHQISGVSWLTIFRYFPSIIFMMTVFATYIFGRREGFGWEAAFFVALMPTTVGIMGPAFLIPLAMGLLFVPLGLFLAFNYRSIWSVLTLFGFTVFLMAIHAPSAICFVIILAPFILVNLRNDWKHSLKLTLALAIPFVVTLPFTLGLILSTAKSLPEVQEVPFATHSIPRMIQLYGYIPIFCTLVGVFALTHKASTRGISLVLALLALLVMGVTFFTLQRGVQIMYLRGLVFTMLMMSILAGAGLKAIRDIKLPITLGRLPVGRSVGILLSLGLIGFILATAIPARQQEPYYHMINKQDYETFGWERDKVDDSYNKAILDPWKATAFAAITGKHVFTRIHMRPLDRDREARNFLSSGCEDSAFLEENDISIVVTQEECSSANLSQVHKNVYLFQPDGE